MFVRHRGGAPNYQPKPLIAKHHFDPVKAWKRRHGISTKELPIAMKNLELEDQSTVQHPKVHVYFAGTGGTASKLAERLKKFLKANSGAVIGEYGCLNSFDATKIHMNDTFLSIKKLDTGEFPEGVKYSIFGLGDDAYRSTFNGAAEIIDEIYHEKLVAPLLNHKLIESDVSVENPPLKVFRQWKESIISVIDGKGEVVNNGADSLLSVNPYLRHRDLLKTFSEGAITFEPMDDIVGGILKLTIEITENDCQDMGHIRILPRNSTENVQKVMEILNLPTLDAVIDLRRYEGQIPNDDKWMGIVSTQAFLSDYVDLCEPFTTLKWAGGFPEVENISVLQVLSAFSEQLHGPSVSAELRHRILLSMPTLRPRIYSLASSNLEGTSINRIGGNNQAEILVRVLPEGRFSSTCISSLRPGDKISYKLAPNTLVLPLLPSPYLDPVGFKPTHVILIGTGTGLAPILSFLSRRLTQLIASGSNFDENSSITLFAGFRSPTIDKPDVPDDRKLFEPTFRRFSSYGLFSELYYTPSNEAKIRVQDTFETDDVKHMLLLRIIKQKAWIFVCGGAEMVKGVKDKLGEVLGEKALEQVSEEGRLLCEVF
ncbi:uncharacterized protein LY89DRAFT_740537 [Mollisia scopiformis]|uniref:NADPH--hemoprotein reductase n=1 Tax=Mollisia scopiformis TaxID=149040 RepID=A0A132BE73_MOLSC|nr:uncharacterized protein LY89DRAFT_740537 [Mollisia scopiformis]KUJ10144.1 hypothetical protein LY89DRAFT_740537 [Mollisia scopiformis]